MGLESKISFFFCLYILFCFVFLLCMNQAERWNYICSYLCPVQILIYCLKLSYVGMTPLDTTRACWKDPTLVKYFLDLCLDQKNILGIREELAY